LLGFVVVSPHIGQEPGSTSAGVAPIVAKISQTQTGDLEKFLPDVWKREDAAEPAAPEK
jgi:hypothetical protein